MTINEEEWLRDIEKRVSVDFFKTLSEASLEELHYVFSREALGLLKNNWTNTMHHWNKQKAKMAYYFSAEFLMGRWLSNALINMGVYEEAGEAAQKLGINMNALEEAEADAGLGNGGLGRLAACFLDSLATGDYPSMGYGIRYRYGMFEQKIVNGYQVEKPDNWLEHGDVASIHRPDEAVEVKFWGRVAIEKGKDNHNYFHLYDYESVIAVPYDLPVPGYNTKTVVTLRLWEAVSPDGFDLDLFQAGEYSRAVAKEIQAENISRVLYPNDNTVGGKQLRLRQQYFFVSAGMTDLIRRFKKQWGKDFSKLPDAVAIQLNDTHPVVAIPELMRILVDEEHLNWDSAWQICIRTFAYTNHTLLAEALEKWPINIFAPLLPRIYQIIEEINRRFLHYLHQIFPGDWQRHKEMEIISDGVIKMAWLAIVGSHSINGVAELHTNLLKTQELRLWYELFPDKFNNKTNGVTQRRWLLKANPALSEFITKRIGDAWIKDLNEISKLEAYAEDPTAQREFLAIKAKDKQILAEYIARHNNIKINTSSIFDVQIKRLHEYKRQLLNALHIIYLYQRLKADPNYSIVPRTFIFGAKAASGYHQAKLIIRLINAIADVVNNDPVVSNKIKVVFMENYRVSLAEKIFPAADVSEQISTAGYEASGTGNMKFMMNGAITLGTLDGANVEILELVGHENAFIFGLTAEEVNQHKMSYNPQQLLAHDAELSAVVEALHDPIFATENIHMFEPIYQSLLFGVDGNPPDKYMVLKDFRPYLSANKKLEQAYLDEKKWAKMALINIARSGKFSSDRTIKQYADEIWHIKPNPQK
ncbi:glycogen/starch/alpha-glucan phosphorylase [Entomospira nematocerorum]|uniref:Alpha-1,4 glucan phosphorylase n=1 Tax=Entomospira nematocerorum TaxID=2719987 RepID=A0A968GCS4_9SPIO|nr:glycogen/starch/alpha-glucan phosphorylase [Entomospira nematocera]NIZ46677.1 glycogen/starch/alpha-glucan phosphorylase [Entomospira nematocera]WDI33526.1 glycogen/starch/alpha-glucan phosphorylase [Entomospira nematocera]